MATTKKYMSLTRLTEYDSLIKAEIDSKIATVNTSITNITNGDTVVKEAEHAENATTADSCTGNAATATTATKLGTTTVGSTTQPIYLNNGTATGITKIDIAHGGTNATTVADARTNLGVYSTSEVDTKLSGKSDTSHNHDSAYDAKGAAASALTSAQTYADNAAAAVKDDLLNGAGTAYDTLKELGDLIDDNQDAIEALEAVAAGKADASHTHTVSEITDLTATATELNYMDGVTSNVQTQLDGKAASGHTHSNYASTVTTTGSGNAVTAVSQSGNTITVTKGSTFLTAHPTITMGTDSTSTGAPAFGGTFTAIDSVTKDGNGHVTKVNTKTVTIPSTAATTSALGLVKVDSSLSSSSTNPVQNKIINNAITTLTSTVSTNTSSISANTESITALQEELDSYKEITSAEIQALFS